jgi:hypothetical protein
VRASGRVFGALSSAGLLVLASVGSADDLGHASRPGPVEATPTARVEAESLNGFALVDLRVPRAKIIAGGPEREAIQSIDAPRFVGPKQARWVRSDTPVIGVTLGEEARCYPVHLMEYHQVANDVLGGRPIAVTYDPLTDAAIAYHRDVAGRRRVFGVSGLLYASGFLLFDRESDTLWSQFLGQALAGPDAGRKLGRIRVRVESMATWLERHPATTVLAPPEQKRLDYRHSPYSGYWTSKEMIFPVEAEDARFHPKELVLGLRAGSLSRAYLGSIVTRAGTRIVDDFAGQRIRLAYDGESGTYSFDVPGGVEVTTAYWFAWKSFHPDTEIWGADLPR